MARLWKAVYVDELKAAAIDAELAAMRDKHQEFDYDEDWEKVEEDWDPHLGPIQTLPPG